MVIVLINLVLDQLKTNGNKGKKLTWRLLLLKTLAGRTVSPVLYRLNNSARTDKQCQWEKAPCLELYKRREGKKRIVGHCDFATLWRHSCWQM